MLKKLIKRFPHYWQKPIRYIYFSLPDFIRFGSVYRTNYRKLEKTDFMDKKTINEYQLKRIRELLRHAYNTVPYYHDLFDEKGIDINEIKTLSDFEQKIPYLTKEDIQNNIQSMVSNKFKNKDLKYSTTGGSTGTPMGFFVHKKDDRAIEWAFTTHIWSRVGYDVMKNNKMVIIRGNVPENGIFEYRNRNLILSSYSLNDYNIKNYLKMITKFDPDFIQAYPSSIVIIANYILNNSIDVKLNKLKAILCASENLYDYQREIISKAFNVRVFSFYGHSEHCSIAGECEESTYYHFEDLYGYTELINEDGNKVKEENEKGEIVSTSLNNFVMPLIRYKTGDIAVNTNEFCKCGRKHKLIKKIEGRIQEQIVIEDGSKVAMTSLIFAQHFKAFGKMKSIQLEQNEIGKVIVRIVQKEEFTDNDINEIITKMEKACNNKLDVELRFVESINRTSRGKQKLLIQNIEF